MLWSSASLRYTRVVWFSDCNITIYRAENLLRFKFPIDSGGSMELHSRCEYGSLSRRVKDLVEEIKQLNHKIAGFLFIWRITR